MHNRWTPRVSLVESLRARICHLLFIVTHAIFNKGLYCLHYLFAAWVQAFEGQMPYAAAWQTAWQTHKLTDSQSAKCS